MTVVVSESRKTRASNPNRGAKPGERRGGRQKGTPNRATREFRETIQRLLDANHENIALWLGQVASDDPSKALEHIARLAEFAAPKLSRAEVTGKDGADLPAPSVTVRLVSAKD